MGSRSNAKLTQPTLSQHIFQTLWSCLRQQSFRQDVCVTRSNRQPITSKIERFMIERASTKHCRMICGRALIAINAIPMVHSASQSASPPGHPLSQLALPDSLGSQQEAQPTSTKSVKPKNQKAKKNNTCTETGKLYHIHFDGNYCFPFFFGFQGLA